MTVWFCCPSARPQDQAEFCFEAWRERGYRTAAIRPKQPLRATDLGCIEPRYLGWAASVDRLAALILAEDPDCTAIATGGDDCWPDPAMTAAQIEAQFVGFFDGTFGVMQPTGCHEPAMDQAATMPWLGREWCERACGGLGPLWPQYRHYFADAELKEVAGALNRYIEVDVINQDHRHWKKPPRQERPPHLLQVAKTWEQDRDLFEQRKAEGWPGGWPR